MNKNITIIGINFYPEDTSTGLYTTQMAEYLSKLGYNISVITGFPYYPQWEIWEKYKNKPKLLEEKLNGIKIYRFKQFTPKNPNFKNRIKHILSFTFGSLKNIKKIKQTDLIIAIVPFTSDVLLANLLAKKTNAKVWVHVQDFEFDAAFSAGVIEEKGIKKYIAKLLFKIEEDLFNKADILSSISYSMIEKAKQKTKTELFYFPNWIDADFINPNKAKIHPYLKSEKFKILYSGNIGAKQDWEFFLQIVNYFKEDKNIEFIIVGTGSKSDWLFEKIKDFPNVKTYKPVPYQELNDLLCSADLHILFQKSDIIDAVMPSKLLGMMASAKPSLITGNLKSDTAKILKESKGGAFFEAGDLTSTVEFIEKIRKNNIFINHLGINARKYVIERFSKENVLGKFENKIKEILGDANA